MKNLIYQFWDTFQSNGKIFPCVEASSKSMKKYAERIGAEYKFELNPPHLHSSLKEHNIPQYYGSVNPVFREEFHEYDNVLFTDADVFVVDDIEESIFDSFTGDIGICEEIFEPKRQIHETKRLLNKNLYDWWATANEQRFNMHYPRTDDGLLRAFNSGVVLYSNNGMKMAKEHFIPFKDYCDNIVKNNLKTFFAADQHYINTSMWNIYPMLSVQIMDYKWNTEVVYYDKSPTEVLYHKTEDTKFVHIQLRHRHLEKCRWNFDEELLWKITNKPVNEWGLNLIDITEQKRKQLL
jgi:lipopolysaccharide biosynthesis glycosyltransferase